MLARLPCAASLLSWASEGRGGALEVRPCSGWPLVVLQSAAFSSCGTACLQIACWHAAAGAAPLPVSHPFSWDADCLSLHGRAAL